ncbi:Formylglycine-generating enzyme, required for sulfatase activity, contains SUMF1/FGE domain [Salegentibacter echinorum]|uniref:Formylglycine-generating enzyme, required for sulfatase activity, contains SUMF1/FGE domain n=1 Tax=Salegentibacter echinorum TaxID=1073325 RepID=A0A1M5EAY2_SALEC|nr:formylglycine-generating enzyme family protein [Salegentibacter echinorum]SHF76357.1 Formylglycine-generating enzyme, required for sulfatase activity, contains SUMF1/FGE domain [Salegentibacter echinorum]
MIYYRLVVFILSGVVLFSCKNKENDEAIAIQENSNKEKNFKVITKKPSEVNTPEGMVWIPGGTFIQGARAEDEMAMKHEKPAHQVTVDGFFMDITEVTNAEFREFVEATGYVTIAEREIEWEEMKKQLSPGTAKPHDSILQPGSLTFKKTKNSVPNLYDYSQWWDWTIGANWRHPEGPGSSIEGKDNYPVVHIAYKDALAYCEWAGRRLPTEAEWEYAARGGQEDAIFTWGNDLNKLSEMANSWEGEFPKKNTKADGFENKAPVKSYPANPYGLYEMAGNVWEFTQDWYNVDYYKDLEKKGNIKNPMGPEKAYNPNQPRTPEKVIKGGSYLCHESYCASFRISARMANSTDSAQEHLGFRTVASVDMVGKE